MLEVEEQLLLLPNYGSRGKALRREGGLAWLVVLQL